MSRSKADLEAEIQHLRQQVAALQATPADRPVIDERLCLALGQAPVLVWTANRDLQFTQVAGALRAPACMSGFPISEFFRPVIRGTDPLAAAAAALQGTVSAFAGRFGDAEVSGWVSPLFDRSGAIAGIVGIAVDETARLIAQRDAAGAIERYRSLFDAANEVLFCHDFEGTIVSVNSAIETLLGYSQQEALELSFEDILAPESRPVALQAVHALMVGMTPQAFEATALTRHGLRVAVEIRARLVSVDGRPSGVEGIIRDITSRRALEEQVRQSQKMDAIGVLAGGIAHDFNNLLTGILGYAYILQEEEGLAPSAHEAVDVIIKSGQRAAQLTAQLLGFARRGKRQEVPVDLHATAREVIGLLQRTIDKRIRIVCSLKATRHHVFGDPNQLYQLLLNLCLNARDAMPAGGDLRVTSRTVSGRTLLSVSDTGTGIAPEILERIFEPFFTTKPPSKGTGMGLAMVYGIAKNHGGFVRVETELGKGTSFFVTLPSCDPILSVSSGAAETVSGTGRVLVIDDEEVVRRVLCKMLHGLGYQVTAAGDTTEAIQFYREHHSEIDIVILDMVMPKMSGRECLLALRAVNPHVRAVLSSGYSREGDADELLRSGDVEFLQKPYRMEQLGAVVRKMLSKKAAASGSPNGEIWQPQPAGTDRID